MKKHSFITIPVLLLLVLSAGAVICTTVQLYEQQYHPLQLILTYPVSLSMTLHCLYILTDIFPGSICSGRRRDKIQHEIDTICQIESGNMPIGDTLESILADDSIHARRRFRQLIANLSVALRRYNLDCMKPHDQREMEASAIHYLTVILRRETTSSHECADTAKYLSVITSYKDNRSSAYIRYIRGTTEEQFALALIFLMKAYVKSERLPANDFIPVEIYTTTAGLDAYIKKIICGLTGNSSISPTMNPSESYVTAIFNIINVCRHKGIMITFFFSEALKIGQ